MRRFIDLLSEQDRAIFWIWVRGVAAAYAILIITVICFIVGGPSLGVQVAHGLSVARNQHPAVRPTEEQPLASQPRAERETIGNADARGPSSP